jgi:molybdenum cofactor cytidylyltransferase
MNLVRALRIDKPQSVAFVGAGGKTTAMFQLARQFSSPVLVTTTTHIGTWQVKLADRHLRIHPDSDIDQVDSTQLNGVILLTGPKSKSDRFSGLNGQQIEQAYNLAQAAQIPFLIEADGSKQRPIKAPDVHEPVIPRIVDMVVVVAGLSAVDKALTEQWVHRPHKYVQIAGLSVGDCITSNAIAKVLTHPEGGLKGIPENARVVALLNQADTPHLLAKGKGIAHQLLPIYQSVIVASLEGINEFRVEEDIIHRKYNGDVRKGKKIFAVIERVAGLILAAGGSVRLGEPKQLLLWRNKTFIEHVVSIAKEAGLWPIIVVSGAYRDQIEQVVEPLSVQLVNNDDWEDGQSTSIRTGLQALPDDIGAAVFLLVDQPQVAPRLIQNLVEVHANTLAPIVAPQIDGRRGNPVLFDRSTFPELVNLTGDIGGRALFSRYSPYWVNWYDPNMLLDVDTHDDYRRLIREDQYFE